MHYSKSAYTLYKIFIPEDTRLNKGYRASTLNYVNGALLFELKSLDKETATASPLNSFKNNLVGLWKYMKIEYVLDK